MIGLAIGAMLSPFLEIYRALFPFSAWACVYIFGVFLYFILKTLYFFMGLENKRKRVAGALLFLPFVTYILIFFISSSISGEITNTQPSWVSSLMNSDETRSLAGSTHAAELVFVEDGSLNGCILSYARNAVGYGIIQKGQWPRHTGIIGHLKRADEYKERLDLVLSEIMQKTHTIDDFYRLLLASGYVIGTSRTCNEQMKMLARPATGQ